jgi:ABC-type nitrate/sulfonate/bicarbonate transport system ATPase subunit
VLAAAVMGFPLMVRAIRLSIEAVDRKLEDAAGTLGASPAWVFLVVTLPLCLPGIVVGMILCFAKAMGEFGATITFVSNIPGETQTLPSAIYTFTQVPGGEAGAMRLTLISIAISVAALFVSEWMARYRRPADTGRMSPVIEVAVAHRLGAFQLDANFTSNGRLTALFGRSGSGKTSLVNIIAGLIRPAAGASLVDGQVLVDTKAGIFMPKHRRRIGYVFQEARLFPHLTVRQNLLFGRWFAPRDAVAGSDLAGVLDLLGIGHLLERRPGALSGGEKQRVAIGRALLSKPRLLLMDEPLASLDEARKAEILPYIERLRDEIGIPIVYVSHSVAEVARLATTLVTVDQGAHQGLRADGRGDVAARCRRPLGCGRGRLADRGAGRGS